ncbi:MAG: hypothetical protein AAF688_08200 [Bacteroidota bacterium]
MFYNLLKFPEENTFPNRLQFFEVIMDDYRPDLFMVCELNSQDGASTLLNSLQFINPDYEQAVFQTNTSDDNTSNSNELQQLIFYDSSKFTLENQETVTTIFRDFNHYQLKLNTAEQETNPVIFDVIVCHLKAASGFDNEQLRLQMVNDLRNYLDTFPPSSKVILAGDLNMYSDDEPGFQELISANNNITFIDPADRMGDWNNNPEFIDVMTQSTRTQSGLGGASGGFDDRFDFIMTSENMATDAELSFVENSYNVYGNNENINCYNRAIDSDDCSGTEFSQFIRTSLYNFSDHLPVTLELQTNQSLSTTRITRNQGLTIIGSNVVNGILRLQNNSTNLTGKKLNLFNGLGQKLKTITIENSLYIDIETNNLANGIYYCILGDQSQRPLKFIVSR